MITEREAFELEKYYKDNPKEIKVKTRHDEDLKELDRTIKDLKDRGIIISD